MCSERIRGGLTMSEISKIDKRLIRTMWTKLQVEDVFSRLLKDRAILNHDQVECLKDTYKSSIWKLEVHAGKMKLPIILKITKVLDEERPQSIVEKNIYTKAAKILKPYMPEIYATKRSAHGLWVFMEHIEPIKGRITYSPKYFERIIPTLASVHAATMGKNFKKHEERFAGWLPRFDSPAMHEERIRLNLLTIHYLDEAMRIRRYKTMLKPHYAVLRKLLEAGPGYFPEVKRAGLSIIHGDLHTANIACHDVTEPTWQIKLIDWEGAMYAPCWYDLVYLVGVYLGYRREWEDQEEEITRKAVEQYSAEMMKNGIHFKVEPLKLYKQAYLKRVLERGLYLQLNWAVTGKKEPKLLQIYLDKLNTWGKQVGLY